MKKVMLERTMKTKLFLCLALVLSGGLFVGCSTTTPHSDVANPLSVSIALLDSPNNPDIYVSINTNCYFHVVITNNSKQPQNLLKEGSSWGWETMSFELIDEKGNKYLIGRGAPTIWTDNAPVHWVLKPGEHYVRDICFAQIYQGQNSWTGFPEQLTNGGNLKVKMKAVFEVDIDKSSDGVPLWHGRIESQPVTCTIFDNRSRLIYPSPYGE
jgi:hypothetical protein